MKKNLMLALLLVVLPLQAVGAQRSGRTYRDPARTFSIRLPSGWTAERSGELIVISSSEYTAKLTALVGRDSRFASASEEVKYRAIPEMSQVLFNPWLDVLRDGASRVSAERAFRTKVKGLDAMRMNVTYYRGSSPRKGYALYVMGGEAVYFFTLTGDEDGLEAVREVFSTIQFEP